MTIFERARVAVKAFREGVISTGTTIDSDDDLYRRITGTTRDLNPITQDRAREVAYHLWRTNPMAKRVTETLVDFVVGDGITFSAVDPDVQDWIDKFWDDRTMRLNMRNRDFVRDLSLNGELCLRAYVNEVSGRVRLGFIDPARIETIAKDPDNMLIDAAVILRSRDGHPVEPLMIVQLDEETDPTNPVTKGDTFYYAINRPTAGRRGTPDLLCIADWVDGYDQMLWNIIDRSAFLNAFVWDVTVNNADDQKLTEWQSKHSAPPKPGSVRAHNQNEVWSAVSPDLGAAEMDVASKVIKLYALGGAGLPEGWFADGDSANRATLAEQGDPTYRMLSSRQEYERTIWEDILAFVVEQGILHGQLAASVDRTIVVNIPEPSSADVKGIVAALPQLAAALSSAAQEGMVSKGTARKLFAMIASLLGMEINPEDEEEAIEQEKADAELEDVPEPSQDMMDAAAVLTQIKPNQQTTEQPVSPPVKIGEARRARRA